jgi:cytochrome P450
MTPAALAHPLLQDCKFAVESDVLPDGTFIPAGGLLMYPPYTINRLPSFWGEDANKFRSDSGGSSGR